GPMTPHHQSNCNSPSLTFPRFIGKCDSCQLHTKATNLVSCTSCRKSSLVYEECSTKGCPANWHKSTCQEPKFNRGILSCYCENCQQHTKEKQTISCKNCKNSATTFSHCSSPECHSRWSF
uniref:AvrSr27 n=1 Tax=Puccinia graminis f. sp. tritici TaxID=56615 RepID=UPI0032D6DB6A